MSAFIVYPLPPLRPYQLVSFDLAPCQVGDVNLERPLSKKQDLIHSYSSLVIYREDSI